MFKRGDGRKPNIFRSSSMMNYQPQHIQKRDMFDIQKIEFNYKSKNKTLSHSIKSKNAPLQAYMLQLNRALLERWPQACRVKITFTELRTNYFVCTTKNR